MSPPTSLAARPRAILHDLHPSPADVLAEVVEGLSRTPKRLPPKLFYDRAGSNLFEAITELPEYYPTRTEIGILRAHGDEMAKVLGPGQVLVELGSGSSLKIRILLDALKPAVYCPVDISRDHLLDSAQSLALAFPGLAVHAVCADYTAPFDLPVGSEWGLRSAFFPGSSIGNFEPAEAQTLLKRVGALVGDGGRLLIGVDVIKDSTVIERAYNDDRGVTARFNLNLLARLNRELKADFDLHAFAHRAFYNPEPHPQDPEGPGRIEMHLKSLKDQRVRIGDHIFGFRRGETIHTECSYKYPPNGLPRLARGAGFCLERTWTDTRRYFAVHCLRFEAAAFANPTDPL
jgi:dimethylhistidine N-methyltransferase